MIGWLALIGRPSAQQLRDVLEPRHERGRQIDAGHQHQGEMGQDRQGRGLGRRGRAGRRAERHALQPQDERAERDEEPEGQRQRQPGRALEGRADDEELAHEHAHRRQADDGEDAEHEAPAEQRMGDGEAANVGDLLRALDLGDLADGVEDRRLGQAVHRHVQERGEIGERTADPEGEDDDAHMLDRGIGEHALHVAAAVEHEGGEHDRDEAERRHQRARARARGRWRRAAA